MHSAPLPPTDNTESKSTRTFSFSFICLKLHRQQSTYTEKTEQYSIQVTIATLSNRLEDCSDLPWHEKTGLFLSLSSSPPQFLSEWSALSCFLFKSSTHSWVHLLKQNKCGTIRNCSWLMEKPFESMLRHCLKQPQSSKNQVLGYFPSWKQETCVSVHSKRIPGRLTWWSSNSTMHHHKGDPHPGLQLGPFIPDQQGLTPLPRQSSKHTGGRKGENALYHWPRIAQHYS